MKAFTAFCIVVCPLALSSLAVAQHNPGKVLFKRTDGLNVGGDDFTGDLPDNTDQAAPFGTLDDPDSSIIEQIHVETEGGAPAHGISLAGDNFDLAFVWQFFDDDGLFSFTENFDDRVQIVITPISGPTNLTATGATQTHSDVAWNVRTYANYDFGAGGWFNADVHMTEDGGGAQSAGGIGFGYANSNTSIEGDFALVGGGAVFDQDPANNNWDFGALINSFDPNIDSDGDNIPDGYEEQLFPGDLTQLGPGDFDSDGVNDPDEYNDGTDPTVADVDNDGSNDGQEKAAGTDPFNPDSDNDGLLDGVETNTGVFIDAKNTGTDPLNSNSDGDNAGDGVEVDLGTDPNDPNDSPTFQIVLPSFVPINSAPGASYKPDLNTQGLDYEENHYAGGVIFNNDALNNYNVHSSGTPAPLSSHSDLVPFLDHGAGGTTIANNNLPFPGGAGENFTVRVNGYLDFTGMVPGTYNIHLGADDTNYFVMDTLDGQVLSQHNCCPQNFVTSFTITAVGFFPFDNVFGEQGGGDWTDLGISGPGINGIVALGDTANGSPPVYSIMANTADDDNDTLPDGWEEIFSGAGNLADLDGTLAGPGPGPGTGDFDGDGRSDKEEFDEGTDPTDPDTDGDGSNDGDEKTNGTHPNDPDSDNDGLLDGVETNTGVFNGPNDTGTDPNNANTDGDDIDDGVELALGRNPLVPDSTPPPTTTYKQDFDAYPDNSTELGDHSTIGSNNGPAYVDDQRLRLSSTAIGSTHSSFRMPKLNGSSAGWTATFDYTLVDLAGGNAPADGFAFSYGAIPPYTLADASDAGNGAGEEAWSTGIDWVSVEVDTWDNGGGEGGVNIASNTSAHPDHAFIPGVPLLQGETRSGNVSITWHPDDGLSVIITGLVNDVNLENIAIPGFTGDDDFIFVINARTGGATEDLFIDNICITTEASDLHQFTVASPDGGTNLELSWKSSAAEVYTVVSTDDPVANPDPNTWPPVAGLENLAATPPLSVYSIPKPADPLRLYMLIAGPVPPLFSDDFESGGAGWTSGVNDAFSNTLWELGTPNGTTGPDSGADGSDNAYATNLGNYGDDSDIFLRSPETDLTGLAGATLSMDVFRDADGFADTGTLRVLRAGDLVQLGADIDLDMTIIDTDWASFEVSLPVEAAGETIVLEFQFVSDASGDAFGGLAIDNVSLSAE